jgi:hypothetical protein
VIITAKESSNGFKAEVVSLDEGKYSVNDLLVHDETSRELAFILSNLWISPASAPLAYFTEKKRHL